MGANLFRSATTSSGIALIFISLQGKLANRIMDKAGY
jgi:hypothetical protein